MAQVSILRRSRLLLPPAAGAVTEVVEVAYSTINRLPRVVQLPLDLYRPATQEELVANSRYQMLPVNEAAAEAERQAISTDMKADIAAVRQTFELP